MPYNTTAIPPRKEATGQTQLPLTRVRKIIQLDPDVTVCSNNAAFVITLATELFVQYLASEAQNMVKLDRKPRRNVQYKDVSSAASRVDRLEFLQDTVPPTVPFGKIKGDAVAAQGRLRGGAAANKTAKADRTSTSAAAAPTAIASLTNGAPADGKKKGHGHQQQLNFAILNGNNNSNSNSGFLTTTDDSAVDGSGVAATVALAHAAAASGADEAGPNDQLQQDMLRVHDDDVEMSDS